MDHHLKRSMLFCQHVARRFLDDHCFSRASALTFTTLLALVPLLVVVLSVLAAFPVFRDVALNVQEFIFENFVPATGEAIKEYLLNFVNQASNLSMFGLVFLVMTAVLMLYTIEEALNDIWHVTKPRKGISTFMLYWAILTLSPLLLGGSITLSTFVLSFSSPQLASISPLLTKGLVSCMTLFMSSAAFSILYMTIPNCSVPLRAGIYSGIFAAILYELAKIGFGLYITHFSSYQVIYGALASIPIFLMWIYLAWLIVLLGAEVSHNLAFSYGYSGKKKIDSFIHAFRWINHLKLAQRHGTGLSLLELVRLDHCNYDTKPEVLMDILQEAGFICKNSGGKYFLSIDLNHTTLYDFYQRLPWKIPHALSSLPPDHAQKTLNHILEDCELYLREKLSVPIGELD